MSPTTKVVKKTAPLSSEIDDIFTRKAETATVQASSPNLKQKRRKKKRPEPPPAEPNAPTPEIVLDPSTQRLHASTSKTVSHDRLERPQKKRKVVETKSDEDKFKDSRGAGPRRKTDEGFAIYKEDELGIDPEAGGTPLCPFDCTCCF